MWTINAALCEHYVQTCPGSIELTEACDKVDDGYQGLKDRLQRLDILLECGDFSVG